MNDHATSSEELDRLRAEQTALEWRLTREPVTCPADLAAKFLASTGLRDDQGTISEPDLLAECEALVAGRAVQYPPRLGPRAPAGRCHAHRRSRRPALGGVPVFDVVGEPMPLPKDETPVLALYRRRRAHRDRLNGPATRGMPEGEYEALVDLLDHMEAEMDCLPAQTITDLAAKVLCLSGNGEGAIPDGAAFFAERRALMAQAGVTRRF